MKHHIFASIVNRLGEHRYMGLFWKCTYVEHISYVPHSSSSVANSKMYYQSYCNNGRHVCKLILYPFNWWTNYKNDLDIYKYTNVIAFEKKISQCKERKHLCISVHR